VFSASHALLRQLRASFEAHLGEVRYYDEEAGCELWMLTAIDHVGERWTAKHEDYDKAAVALAGLMGVEVEDRYGQPAANCCWKQTKSATLRTGGIVELSQLAYGSPAE
jgi:hypothetical protein